MLRHKNYGTVTGTFEVDFEMDFGELFRGVGLVWILGLSGNGDLIL